MKKVIGVALAASLVAGMAFADVAVTLNGRVRSNMYHQSKDKDDNKVTRMFNLSDGTNKHGGSGDATDTFTFKANTDYAGVALELNSTAGTSDVKNDGAYNAFMKFGGLKLTFGAFDSRFVNRYNTTAGESGLLDSDDIAKYGTALLNGFATETVTTKVVTGDTTKNKTTKIAYGTGMLKDANNASAVAGSKTVALVADYTFDDVAGGKLLVKGGLLTNNYKTDEDDADNKKYQAAGYMGELDFQNDSVNLQALVKALNEKQTIFGIYAEPKIAKEIPLAFGFSYGQDKDEESKYQGTKYTEETYADADATVPSAKVEKTAGKVGKYTAMAFDARAGYIVNDQLKVSTVAKYESVKVDANDKTCTALAVAGEVSYIVNDLATVFADVGYYNWNLGGEDTFAKVSCVKVRPGVVLNAGAGARVTAAFQYDSYSGDNKAKKNEMSIPVIFRVKL